ncbi:unnamed protein product, partial [Porites lobata]
MKKEEEEEEEKRKLERNLVCIVIYLECYYEGKSHHHGELWSPGPCVPECRCKHGYVKCTKIECPDLNCDAPIKKKWKCCPECLPEMQDGTSCGVWTAGGNGNGGCCVFPFNYHGIKYFTCTYQDHSNPWCAISSDFDHDGVWGECIDKGDARYALRFNRHHGKKANHGLQDKETDMLSAIAKQAANNVTSETGKSDTLSALAQEAANNVTSEGESSSSPYLVPSPSNGASVAVPASNAANVAAVPTTGIPAVTWTQPAATSGVATAAQSYIPSPSPSVGYPVVPQVTAPGTPAAQTMVGTPLYQSASQGIVLPGQSVAPTQSAAVGSQSTGMTYTSGATPAIGLQPSQATQAAQLPTESGTPALVTQPQPQPSQAVQVGQSPMEAASPVIGQPQPQPSQVAQPTQLPTEGGTPPLVVQPVPQPSQVAPPAQSTTESPYPWYPFPATQTTIDPSQTQAINQAVHEVTTTELQENHNITTTESWFGPANETLNRTNEAAAAQGNDNTRASTSNYSYYNQPSNQALYGYQAASTTNEYQSQSQSPYTADQQSYSQGTAGYNMLNNNAADQRYGDSNAQNTANGYYNNAADQRYGDSNAQNTANGYYNNAADQQYQDSQAQNSAGQDSYYSSQQQYQNNAYPG